MSMPPPEDKMIQQLRQLMRKKLGRELTMEEVRETYERTDKAVSAIFSVVTKQPQEKKFKNG